MAALGALFILIGIIGNEWILKALFSPDGSLETRQRIAIATAGLVSITFGCLLYFERRCTWALNPIMSITAILLALLVSETGLRLHQRSNQTTTTAGAIYQLSKTFRHEYVPNQVFRVAGFAAHGEGRVENRINSLGMRGPEIPPKAMGEYRILLLGDSFIEADEIPYEETVGQRLEVLFHNPRIRVLQYGMSGWSPLLELNWLVKRGLGLDPDAVVVFLSINDFYLATTGQSDAAYTQEADFDARGLPLRFLIKPRPPPRRIALWEDLRIIQLAQNFRASLEPRQPRSLTKGELVLLLGIDAARLDRAMEQALPQHFIARPQLMDIIRLTRQPSKWDAQTRETVELSLRYLQKMETILKARRIPFIASLVPFGWNISHDENEKGRREYALSGVLIPMGGIEAKVKACCRKRGVAYIDLYNVFTKEIRLGKKGLYLPADGHWSSRGHLVVAEAIYRFFIMHERGSGLPLLGELPLAAGGLDRERTRAER